MSEVKVAVTQKWYATLHHPQTNSHTQFGIPISKNIRDMHQTQVWYVTLRNPKIHPSTKFRMPTDNNMRYAPDNFFS